MTENELATIAVDVCYKIHTTLGTGLLESVYEAAFAYELDKREIPYDRQKGIAANYEDAVLDVGFRADFIMGNKLIIELKSVEHLERVHHKTVLTYLKLTDIKLAILVNFNVNLIKDGIHRKIHGQLFKHFPRRKRKYPTETQRTQRFFFLLFVPLWEKKKRSGLLRHQAHNGIFSLPTGRVVRLIPL